MPDITPISKEALRILARQRRAALNPAERRDRGATAVARLIALPEYNEAQVILAYWAKGDELATAALITAGLARGKTIVLPRVIGRSAAAGPGLALHRFTGRPDDLVPGPFGLLEPAATAPPVQPADLDLIVLPGLAFDLFGRRLGYGGGYYDRLLAVTPARAVRVALAFAPQVFPAVPQDPLDQPVHILVTDLGVWRTV